MHVISRKRLKAFWEKHPTAEEPMKAWYKLVEDTNFTDFNDVKRSLNSADYAKPFAIFDVGGNNFRVIVNIHYDRQKIFIRYVLTHPEYDGWCKKYRSNKL